MAQNSASTYRGAISKSQVKEQIAMELISKKRCANRSYKCSQIALDNYKYCADHILNDKTAPFRVCGYFFSNGKHCHKPAQLKANVTSPRKEISFCKEHALKTHLLKARQSVNSVPQRNPETLLCELSHYVVKPPGEINKGVSLNSNSTELLQKVEAEAERAIEPLNPFVDINAHAVNAACSNILDLGSEPETDNDDNTLDEEPKTFENTWNDFDADSSDDESLDSDQEDPLKHAGVLTADEVTRMVRDKLSRLQNLYIEEYRHLFHELREKRREYLVNLKKEKDLIANSNGRPAPSRDIVKDHNTLKIMKAYNHYHHDHGTDSVMQRQLYEMRLRMTETLPQKGFAVSTVRCNFVEGGVKCTERSLPVTRHCRKHILSDTTQIMFRMCGKKCGDVECVTPVAAIFDDVRCPLHREMPPVRVYAQAHSEFDKVEVRYANSPAASLDECSIKEETLSVDEDGIVHEDVKVVQDCTMDEMVVVDDLLDEVDKKDESVKDKPLGIKDCDELKAEDTSTIEVDIDTNQINEDVEVDDHKPDDEPKADESLEVEKMEECSQNETE